MFSGFMVDSWIVASLAAIVAGSVGFFVVMRGSAFVAHAVPQGAFAGAAAASLLGMSTILGLGVFSVLTALLIGRLERRGRHDVAVALALVLMLALGALLLNWNTAYEPEIFSLLFGEVLGINDSQVGPTLLLAVVCCVGVIALFRPLLLVSAVPDVAEAGGLHVGRYRLAFLVLVALATSMTLPVVGALLIFSLMVGPPAFARAVTAEPVRALALSTLVALVTVWVSIAGAYQWNWPVGFFIGTLSAVWYVLGRVIASRAMPWRRPRRAGRAAAESAAY